MILKMCLNKLIKLFSFLTILFISEFSVAQTPTKYWVKFKNKTGSPYSISTPSVYLSAKSITRRATQGIAIDLTDIPVNQSYINLVNATGATVLQKSKWLNAAIVSINSPSQLSAINSLTCVLNSTPVGRFKKITSETFTDKPIDSYKKANTSSAAYNYGPSFTQVNQIGADCMHNLGFRGQNVLIAVIDDGFYQADVNPVFDSLRNEGRLLGTRDIVTGNTSVYEDDSHGALVLSLIAGNSPGNLIGTAPKANYWLLRSEDVFSEKIIEEANWVVAAELADSLGADITTTSLGYTTFDNPTDNHIYAHLNGQTSVASIAATMAARKGIIVLNAAGNEGSGSWLYIGIPADADSILSIGSVNGSGIHSNFSSQGPTADGRIKPDVSTMGEGSYVCQPGYSFSAGNGTSFACPIMAGAVACLMQAHPTKTNMQLINAIKATASKSTAPDNLYVCAANAYLQNVSLNEKRFESDLKLYPNPAKTSISFELKYTINKVQLTDVFGKHIDFTLTSHDINHYKLNFNSSLANGVYFISIHTANGIVNSKFIKE
jgi:subtilisin family serine protease